MYSSPVVDVPGRSGTGDVSSEVETDELLLKSRAVVTPRLIPLAGDGGRIVTSNVLVMERSRKLLKQGFDNGIAVSKSVFV